MKCITDAMLQVPSCRMRPQAMETCELLCVVTVALRCYKGVALSFKGDNTRTNNAHTYATGANLSCNNKASKQASKQRSVPKEHKNDLVVHAKLKSNDRYAHERISHELHTP